MPDGVRKNQAKKAIAKRKAVKKTIPIVLKKPRRLRFFFVRARLSGFCPEGAGRGAAQDREGVDNGGMLRTLLMLRFAKIHLIYVGEPELVSDLAKIGAFCPNEPQAAAKLASIRQHCLGNDSEQGLHYPNAEPPPPSSTSIRALFRKR
ncbi:hypothetical protein [Cohnella thermotolerans]|uniref:hypothetical protein n=1 Tax=Cohnella thermotolerans TaxID=329858 RepID=UPI001F0A205A|nr:hypothetical protein [Cohnella thermotolerans]